MGSSMFQLIQIRPSNRVGAYFCSILQHGLAQKWCISWFIPQNSPRIAMSINFSFFRKIRIKHKYKQWNLAFFFGQNRFLPGKNHQKPANLPVIPRLRTSFSSFSSGELGAAIGEPGDARSSCRELGDCYDSVDFKIGLCKQASKPSLW